jgi:hypothetical protein
MARIARPPQAPELDSWNRAVGLDVDGPLARERRARARYEQVAFALDHQGPEPGAGLFRDARDEDPGARGPWRAALFARALTGLGSGSGPLGPDELRGLREEAARLLPEVEDPGLRAAAQAALAGP